MTDITNILGHFASLTCKCSYFDTERKLTLVIKLSSLCKANKFYGYMYSYFPYLLPGTKEFMVKQIVHFLRLSSHLALRINKGEAKKLPIDVLNLIDPPIITDEQIFDQIKSLNLQQKHLLSRVNNIFSLEHPNKGLLSDKQLLFLAYHIRFFSTPKLKTLTYKSMEVMKIGYPELLIDEDYFYPEIEEDLNNLLSGLDHRYDRGDAQKILVKYFPIHVKYEHVDIGQWEDLRQKNIKYLKEGTFSIRYIVHIMVISILARFLGLYPKDKRSAKANEALSYLTIGVKIDISLKLIGLLWTIIFIHDNKGQKGLKECLKDLPIYL